MPIRFIAVPPPIALLDPATRTPLKDEQGQPVAPVSLAVFVGKLLYSPVWGESYQTIKSAKAVDRAFAAANGVVQLAEEDWRRLRDLVENPKHGFPFHPAVLPQLLPFLDAIMLAAETAPPPAEV
jgi:hypothetical protein